MVELLFQKKQKIIIKGRIKKKHLLGSRGRQLHDADSVVGSAAFLIELNVTSQAIDADL